MTEPYYKTHEPPHCPTCDCGMPRDDAAAALGLLSRMRFACGDNGKRMQDELEDYLRELRKDAERYRWLREHFRFANDSMRELWFDPALEPDDAGLPVDLDQGIDAAMKGANAGIQARRRRPSPGMTC